VSSRHACESHIGVNVERRCFAVANSIEYVKPRLMWQLKRPWCLSGSQGPRLACDSFPSLERFSAHFTFFGSPDILCYIMPSFEQTDFKPPSTNDDDNSECSSSYDIGSSSGGDSRAAAAAAKADSDNKGDTLASSEKSIRRSKMLVYTALLLTAAIGTLIYFLMSNEELATCQQNVRATRSPR
jgi:hypothetical protein